jgi:phosphoserine phosphatase RsbU/P
MSAGEGQQAALSWKDWLPRWETSEKLTVVFGALAAGFQLASLHVGLVLLALVIMLGAFGWAFVKWARRLLRHFIWNLRNRLVVAFLFIAVIPLLLLVGLAGYAAKETAGQFAVYLVHSEMERRIAQLQLSAASLAKAPQAVVERAVERVGIVNQERFPGLLITVYDRDKTYAFPEATPAIERTPARGNESGLVVRNGYLFGWAHVKTAEREVTLLAPLTRKFFSDLAPGLCEVSVLHFADPASGQPFQRRQIGFYPMPTPEEEEAAVQAVPPAENRFDFELLWGAPIPIYFWDNLAQTDMALLSVHSRMSAMVRTLFSQRTESGLMPLMYTFAILLLAVEFISIFIGVSITTTITAAVQDLYEGTQRVMKGDFSHRIRVRGGEQVAELSRSFNRMTENVERLLVVAKENERIQAELQIAREVQGQLFPKAVPKLEGLHVEALCHAARTVSGDYYDYQELPSGCLAVAIADVAGKGISAALLMASLQASLRLVMSDVQRLAAEDERGACASFPTSMLVSRINRQLHANTSPEKYATFFFSVYDPASGMLTYTNAGHLPPILVRNGEATMLDVNGMVVGLFPHAPYQESRLQLQPGDVLVCYTDGVTEPENEFGEMFGEERLRQLVLKSTHMTGEQIIGSVIDAVQHFTGTHELQDDMTLLVVKRT